MTQGARRQTTSGNVVALNTRAQSTKTTSYDAKTGGPTDGGDTWRESVEARLGELRTDVRHLLIGGAIVSLTLLGAGWGVYTVAMSEMRDIAVQQEKISGKIDTFDARLTGKMEAINQRLDDKPKQPTTETPQ